MNCPNCSISLQENYKMCGAIKVYHCDFCKYERHEHTGQMNIGILHDWALKEAHFRRLVRKAMVNEGLQKEEEQSEFLKWLIGEDYRDIPYMILNREEIKKRLAEEGKENEVVDDWLTRIKRKLRNAKAGSSVYDVLSASASEFKGRRFQEVVN